MIQGSIVQLVAKRLPSVIVVTLLVGCGTHADRTSDVVGRLVRAIETSDPDLYIGCLDSDRYQYEGRLLSTNSATYVFTYDDDVQAIRRAFKNGRIVESSIEVSSIEKDRALLQLNARFEHLYDKRQSSYGHTYSIATELSLEIGKDQFGRVRIRRITEETPAGVKANANANALPSFGLVKYVSSELFEVGTFVHETRNGPSTRRVIDETFVDRKTRNVLLYAKTIEVMSPARLPRGVPLKEVTFMLLDQRKNMVLNVQ